MDVGVRVAAHRRVGEVGGAAWPVLDGQRRAGRVVAEADPPDRPRVGAVLPALPFRAQPSSRAT